MRLWKALAQKGKISTLIGFLFAFPVNGKFLWDFYRNVIYSPDKLMMIVFINIVSMIWFILPSSIIIKGGNFEIEVKD